MADDNFFNDSEQVEEAQTEESHAETIKVGDKEYSQDELERLVGLGELGKELEDKWSTKIDKLMPEYTKKTQELSELRRQLDSTKVEEVNRKAEAGVQLTSEEIRTQAIAQAKQLGIVTKDDLNDYMENYYTQRREAERLIENVNSLVKDAEEVGKPKTSAESLLKFMQERGFRNPEDAYEIMFKNELREWERKQLDSARPNGLVTESRSTAGSKQPNPVKITKDNLESLVLAEMQKGGN